jgi:hypothetical protein
VTHVNQKKKQGWNIIFRALAKGANICGTSHLLMDAIQLPS